MMIFFIIWGSIGFLHWLDYMFNYCFRPRAMDFILILPVFIIAGGITTIRKIIE